MPKKLIPYLVCAASIGALIVVYLPNFVRIRTHSVEAACVVNLRQLDGAKQQWQLEYNKSTNDTPTLGELKPYIKLDSRGETPRCPQGGTYRPGSLSESPRCSIGGEYHTLP